VTASGLHAQDPALPVRLRTPSPMAMVMVMAMASVRVVVIAVAVVALSAVAAEAEAEVEAGVEATAEAGLAGTRIEGSTEKSGTWTGISDIEMIGTDTLAVIVRVGALRGVI